MKLSFAFLAKVIPWKTLDCCWKPWSRIFAFTSVVPDKRTLYCLPVSFCCPVSFIPLYCKTLSTSLLASKLSCCYSAQPIPFYRAVSFALFSSAMTSDHAAVSFVGQLVPTLASSGKYETLPFHLPNSVLICSNLFGFLSACFKVVQRREK